MAALLALLISMGDDDHPPSSGWSARLPPTLQNKTYHEQIYGSGIPLIDECLKAFMRIDDAQYLCQYRSKWTAVVSVMTKQKVRV